MLPEFDQLVVRVDVWSVEQQCIKVNFGEYHITNDIVDGDW